MEIISWAATRSIQLATNEHASGEAGHTARFGGSDGSRFAPCPCHRHPVGPPTAWIWITSSSLFKPPDAPAGCSRRGHCWEPPGCSETALAPQEARPVTK